MPSSQRHLATRLGEATLSPMESLRLNYRIRPDGEREGAELTPRQIVTALHAEIAAKSPEHARLVAEFERRQAAKQP
jgi:hypothetical protein